jgi:cytochrome c553
METYSARHKLTRRSILEKALNDLRKSTRQKEYAESFKRASSDPEMKSMAEEGLGDYLEQLTRLEK